MNTNAVTYRLALASVALLLCFTFEAASQSTEQASMQECAAAAKTASLSGDARKTFMRECMPSARQRFDKQRGELLAVDLQVTQTLAAVGARYKAEGAAASESRLAQAQEQWQAFRLAHCAFEESRLNGGQVADEKRRIECLVIEANSRVTYLRSLLQSARVKVVVASFMQPAAAYRLLSSAPR